jgi:hypothetical protein
VRDSWHDDLAPHLDRLADARRAREATLAEVDRLRAAIAGSFTPPTEDEAIAHLDAGGLWQFAEVDGDHTPIPIISGDADVVLSAIRSPLPTRWWRLGGDGCLQVGP